MLRRWQIECSDQALLKYKSNKEHFFCQATPGAGKTKLAAEIASRLLLEDMIDLILCFSPSISIAEGIKATFERTLNCSFNGGLGSIGQSLTYQSIQFLKHEFWYALRNHRVFVVFDEIHHCSGSGLEQANAWGQQILTKIQDLATYTLAMSGTPWRSDSMPIAMSEYSTPDGKLIVDYQYSLKRAITDSVCRSPKIILVDNDHLTVFGEKQTESFSSILELLKQTKTSYQSVIHNHDAMEYILGLGCEKLSEIRTCSPNAGGLVVASSVQHAQKIKNILEQKYSQTVSIVTYRHAEPLVEIDRYRQNTTPWIVSVGMISEGTDIPRLQVCCHMSSVKTELYFRQVLGRILRVNSATNQEAWLLTFAEASLIEFAKRIEQDIPDSCIFANTRDKQFEKKTNNYGTSSIVASVHHSHDSIDEKLTWSKGEKETANFFGPTLTFDDITLGNFKHRVIEAFCH